MILIFSSLVFDFINFGHRPESWHKIFHVLVGLIAVYYGWNNKDFWRPFCLISGGFFSFAALFGWIWMDFGGLDAFNFTDTILHSIVGVSGLVIGIFRDD